MVVCFDFDGTVADSMPALTRLAADVLCDRGYAAGRYDAAQLYLGTVGRPFDEQLEVLFPRDGRNPGAATEFAEQKLGIYECVLPVYMVTDAIRMLAEEGIGAVLCSSTDEALVREVIEDRWHERGLFTCVLGRVPHAPKATQVRVSGTHLFVGDAPLDAQVAEQLGIGFVGVPTTFTAAVFTSLGRTVAYSAADLFLKVKERLERP